MSNISSKWTYKNSRFTCVTDCVCTSWKLTLNFIILRHWMLTFLTPKRIQTAWNGTLIIEWRAKYITSCKPKKQGITNWTEQCCADEYLKTWRFKTVKQIPKQFVKKNPTRCNNVSKFLLFQICMKFNMFRATHRPSSGA